MPLKHYQSDSTQVFYKVITHAHQGKVIPLGIAFRTQDAPIGYLPFHGAKDFNFDGQVSLKEELLARLPIDLSAAGSPHTLLIKEAAGDVEFLGSGDENLSDIQQLVKKDLVRHAMACASGVFVDGVMMTLGGPSIKSLVDQFAKSKVKQFILSKAISGGIKNKLKEQGNFERNRFLDTPP